MGEDATEDEPDRTATDGDCAEDPEGLAAVSWIVERRHECAQRGRREHRSGGALQGSGNDQNGERRRCPPESRRRSEGHERDQERSLASDDVADPAPQ